MLASMRPELNVKKKVQALERRKEELDALIAFVKNHPLTACECTLRPLNNRPGLYFADYAIIRPVHDGSKARLRLEKYAENWYALHPEDDRFDFTRRTVIKDVSEMPDAALLEMLDEVHQEMIPEDYEG